MYNEYYEKYPPESVVYFVEGDIPYGYSVNFGIVKEYYSDRILLQMVHLKDCRLINGIPWNDFPDWSEWKKVPKGWENARGCRIEHEVAKAYDLEIIYESIET